KAHPDGWAFCVFVQMQSDQALSSNLSVCSDNIKACCGHHLTIFHFILVHALALIPKTTRRKKM
ncbi:hypothetical protein, partial [Raoultella planticola]|uniref:hypothetical protein n=1 Tax=Raoultella planticola TaxID=575 RepID=UPI003B7ACDBC